MIKQYYSQKILDLETKLQLANGKGIAFYNEVCQATLCLSCRSCRLCLAS